jgi:hypothetical protein
MDTVLDHPRETAAGPRPSRAAPATTATPTATAAPPRGAVFEAVLPAGPLRLRVEAPALRHALDAAIALQHCEAQLDALEAWLGQPLDWRWTEIPMAPAPRGSQVRCAWRVDTATADGQAVQALGSLELPWPLLRAVSAPQGLLAQLLQWPAMPAQLLLSRPRLPRDELAMLEPGGALLLPESFTAPWRGLLRAAGESGDGVPVALDSPLAPRLEAVGTASPAAGAAGVEGIEAAAAHDGPQACEVRLDLPHALPADCLTGWRAGTVLEGTGPGASLWLRAQGRMPAMCLARGQLMPWGCGWALAIESLCEADDATLPVY